MTDKNPGAEHEGNKQNHPKPSSDELVPGDVASSPAGSQTSRSSSSRREHRIVELLHETDSNDNSHRDDNWMIGSEFYDEDIVEHHASDDEHSIGYFNGREQVDRDSVSEDDDDENFEDIIDMEVVPHVVDQSSSDESDEIGDDGAMNNIANYDITLPTDHRYLGENLEEFRGRKIFAEGTVTSLLLFNLRHIVLFPGQVLPITISTSNYRVHAHLKACIANGSTLVGLMSEPKENPIGTTAEIRNYSDQEDELKIIMEGRQRFKLLSSPFETAFEGRVRILPEVSLGRPFPRIPSWQKFMTDSVTSRKFIVSKHPHWILKNYQASSMVRRIIEQVKNWCSDDSSKDAIDFSYWMAANLPISNRERMKALTFDCTEARLAWILDILEKSEFFGCSTCRNVICHKKDVFPMSCSGPQNSFVNSNGYVHDTLTVRNARGLMQEQDWYNEFSWFPGYSWRVACCENCGGHIGWCYRTTKSETKPKKFFGLSRANIRLQSSGQMPEQVLAPIVFRVMHN